tara:strand:+ start:1372 stop:1647 length:276 start_codon:yes stop_codon:yes gene_type:complete
MFILTIKNKENDGAYAVERKDGTRILQLFEEEDDAKRYVDLLEADGCPNMSVYEIEAEQAIAACENFGYNYTIVSSDDFVIPMSDFKHDFI